MVQSLDELVADYGKLDTQVKALKKLQDTGKEEIKTRLTALSLDSYSAGGFVVKKIVSQRESFDEEKALVILKHDWVTNHGSEVCPYIKTKQYLDMAELENAIYNKNITPDILKELDGCREVTPVITLKCSAEKK